MAGLGGDYNVTLPFEIAGYTHIDVANVYAKVYAIDCEQFTTKLEPCQDKVQKSGFLGFYTLHLPHHSAGINACSAAARRAFD